MSGPGRSRLPWWTALGALVLAVAVVARVALSGTGAAAPTTSTMTQPPATAPTAAVPLQPAPGIAGKPLRAGRLHQSSRRVERHAGRLSPTRVIAGREVTADVYNGSFAAPT